MLVDTNILVYAINSSASKHELARNFLRNEFQNVVIAHQNILESLRVLTHSTYPSPLSIKQTVGIMNDFTSTFRVIFPQEETIYVFHKLLQKYSCASNSIFDAYLVATAITNGITTIATDNERHFRVFEEITVFNPFATRNN